MKLSDPQFRALEDIEKHGDPCYRLSGRSQWGGWFKVERAIRSKFLARTVFGRWELTPTGHAVLVEERKRRSIK